MISVRRASATRALTALLVVLSAGATRAVGQTVVEVQAGGTSLYDSYGGSVHFYTSRFTGWLGVGYQDGFKLGAAIQTSFHQDSLRVGSSVLLEKYATDLFSTGVNVLTQDIRYTWVRKRTIVMAAAGSAAAAYGSQFFQAYSFDDPFGALSARHEASRQVTLGFDGVVASQQSAIGSVAYFPLVNLGLAASGGVGSNAPYGAVALEYRNRYLAVRTSYVGLGDNFRRAALPYPAQTEAYKENIQVDWQPWPQIAVGVARQNYLQSATDSTPSISASGNTVYGSVTRFGVRAQAGLYDSHSQGLSNLSTYFALGYSFGQWVDAELYLLQSRPSIGPMTNTPIVSLREHISRRFSLLQQVSFNNGDPTFQFGGDVVTPIGDLSVSYQIVQQPFAPLDPFNSVLSISARLQLGRYSTSLNTVIQPDGSVNYTATASTFLYLSQFGGMQPNLVSPQIGKFVISGRVVDEQGQPVDGAALDFDGNVAFTNPEGQFLIRLGRPRDYKLTILLSEFLTPGRWEVVSAPSSLQALPEERATSTDVVVRQVVIPAPETAPPAGPAPAPEAALPVSPASPESIAPAPSDSTHGPGAMPASP